MTRLTIDPALSAQLGASPHAIELYDPGGRSLGLFVPNKALYAKTKSPNSDEELTRRERAGGGRPLAEILADFETTYGQAKQ